MLTSLPSAEIWSLPASGPVDGLEVTADNLGFVNAHLPQPIAIAEGRTAFLFCRADYPSEEWDYQ